MRFIGATQEARNRRVLIILLFIACSQIMSTYGVLSQTYDEPLHIAAGMQWIQHKTYQIESLHPPLARIAAAVGPYLSGRRLSPGAITWPQAWNEGNGMLHVGSYSWNLGLARLGILPFFVVATVAVWRWTTTLFGYAAALLAVLLFTTLPPILAHSGLATTDMAAATTLLCVLYTFTLWLENPCAFRSAALGIALGLAILSKFSNVVFVPACIFTIVILRLTTDTTKVPRTWLTGLCVVAITSLLVTWAGYRFGVRPLLTLEERPHNIVNKFVGQNGTFHEVAYSMLEAPIWPLLEIRAGITTLIQKNREGHNSYFMGKLRETGVWYYFPTVLGLKTPIPFIVFWIAGLFALRDKIGWQMLVPAITAITVLLVCLLSNINIGSRHILGIYPLLAVVAGLGAAFICKVKRGFIGAIVLLIWQVGSTIRSNPDYLAYSNELAGSKLERFLVDSDLDWGQDLRRLSKELKDRSVNRVSLGYFGTADIKRHGLPEVALLQPDRPVSGWIAISVTKLQTENGFEWLESYKPVTMIGKSIRLYNIQ